MYNCEFGRYPQGWLGYRRQMFTIIGSFSGTAFGQLYELPTIHLERSIVSRVERFQHAEHVNV
jgi:hypothetical protein